MTPYQCTHINSIYQNEVKTILIKLLRMRNVSPIWNPYQERTRKIWIYMEFVWVSHPHSFPMSCLMKTFQPMYFPYSGNEQKMTPYQCHTTIWPSHISATYGSHMAQKLPYLSHSFALVREGPNILDVLSTYKYILVYENEDNVYRNHFTMKIVDLCHPKNIKKYKYYYKILLNIIILLSFWRTLFYKIIYLYIPSYTHTNLLFRHWI